MGAVADRLDRGAASEMTSRRDDPFARLDPSHAALIVVDVQNDYVHPAGALGAAGADMSAVTAMIPRLELLVESARRSGIFTDLHPQLAPTRDRQ